MSKNLCSAGFDSKQRIKKACVAEGAGSLTFSDCQFADVPVKVDGRDLVVPSFVVQTIDGKKRISADSIFEAMGVAGDDAQRAQKATNVNNGTFSGTLSWTGVKSETFIGSFVATNVQVQFGQAAPAPGQP